MKPFRQLDERHATTEAAKPKRWSDAPIRVALALPVGVLVLQTYVILHEGGHAIAGMAFGGTLASLEVVFWDFGAHVGFQESFTGWRRSVISVSGALVPLLAWVVFIMAMPRRTGAVVGWLKFVASAATLNTLIPWVVIPLTGRRPPGDDVTHFLEHSGLTPWLVATAFVLAYASGWALFLLRIPGIRPFVSSLAGSRVGGSERRSLVAIAAITVASVAVGAGLTAQAERWTLDAPAGLEQVGTESLGDGSRMAETIHAFALSGQRIVHIYAVLEDVEHGPLLLELHGPNGAVRSLFRGDSDLRVGRATVDTGKLVLAPGEYRILLSSPQGRGTVSVWLGLEPTS